MHSSQHKVVHKENRTWAFLFLSLKGIRLAARLQTEPAGVKAAAAGIRRGAGVCADHTRALERCQKCQGPGVQLGRPQVRQFWKRGRDQPVPLEFPTPFPGN